MRSKSLNRNQLCKISIEQLKQVVLQLFLITRLREHAIACTRGKKKGGGEVEPTKFSKVWGLMGPQFLERGCWERGWCFFFQGREGEGLQFFDKKTKIWNI